MLDLEVIADPAAAAVALDPVRSRLLAELGTPASAAILAERVGMARQKVTYHLKALEAHALVRVAERRQWGGITELLYVASAGSYVVSPEVMGRAAPDPARSTDRLSASYLLALAARAVREVGALWRRSQRESKRLATLSIDADITFATPADRAAFTDEMHRTVATLAAKYHDARAPRGRAHRVIVLAYPGPMEKKSHADED